MNKKEAKSILDRHLRKNDATEERIHMAAYTSSIDAVAEVLERNHELLQFVIDRLSSLQRVEITKYKSTANKETLKYRKSEYGWFITVGEVYKLKRDLEEMFSIRNKK